MPEQRRPVEKDRQLRVVGARENNLDNVSVNIPLGVLVAVTGVSGSGKSTLVNQILAKTLQNQLNGARQVPGRVKKVGGLEHLDKLVQVDQSPIGRTPRSNPATYTGLLDPIRSEFAKANDRFKIVGGFMGETVVDQKGVEALSKLPTLDEVRSQLIGLLNAPATKVAQVVQAPAGKLARVFAAYGDSQAA